MARKKTARPPAGWLEAFRRWGAEGGTKRAKRLTAQERSDSASKAAQARWSKKRAKP